MKKRNFLSLSLIFIGIIFLLKNPIQTYLIKQVVVANPIDAYTTELFEENKKRSAQFDFDQTRPVTWESILESHQNRTDLPVIGGLAIPSLELQLPLLNGLAEENLVAGAGTMTPTQKLGQSNYSLVSHNYAKTGILFSDLQYMSAGDLVYLTDLKDIYIYQVDTVEMVSPDRVDVIAEVPGEKLLTLITCSDDILNRWVSQGHLKEIVPFAQASDDLLDILDVEKATAP